MAGQTYSVRTTVSVDGLGRMAAAIPDHIIAINPNSYRYDGFLIQHDRMRVAKLPDLTVKEVQKQAHLRSSQELAPSLEWLRDVVAGLSLQALGFTDPVSNETTKSAWFEVPPVETSIWMGQIAKAATRKSTEQRRMPSKERYRAKSTSQNRNCKSYQKYDLSSGGGRILRGTT